MNLTGWALLFHPDLLHGTPLERTIKEYTFFDYSVNEALHMTEEEHDMIQSLMRRISDELQNRRDEVQDSIIVSYIGLVLNYCRRFYSRRFHTRRHENSDILTRFDALLRDYFDEKLQMTLGIPSVRYCAERLCMSPNYFGDVIKKATGDTASNYIRNHIIRRAKNALASGAGIAQAAYSLGFEYPQHFSRMFRKQAGMAPSEYMAGIRKEKEEN